MSQLFYVPWTDKNPHELLASFVGTPRQTLGDAIAHFEAEELARLHRITSGEIPCVPEVILENAKKRLAMSPVELACPYSVQRIDNGYSIFISDGADKYILID